MNSCLSLYGSSADIRTTLVVLLDYRCLVIDRMWQVYTGVRVAVYSIIVYTCI